MNTVESVQDQQTKTITRDDMARAAAGFLLHPVVFVWTDTRAGRIVGA